jgi:hypothetical protein
MRVLQSEDPLTVPRGLDQISVEDLRSGGLLILMSFGKLRRCQVAEGAMWSVLIIVNLPLQ